MWLFIVCYVDGVVFDVYGFEVLVDEVGGD